MKYPYCLSCGEPLKANAINGWMPSCLKKMFGSYNFPHLDFDVSSLNSFVLVQVKSKQVIPGVQKKLSLNLTSINKKGRLTLQNYPFGYILKPQANQIDFPESENLVMNLANKVGIKTALHGLIPLEDGSLAYICKRMDRDATKKYPMEDFCQLSGRLTENKYDSSYERCKSIIARYSDFASLDEVQFFIRVVFSFLTGNSDMHLKNFSLINFGDGYHLSPAYDLLPVNVVFPLDKEETALTINGKKKNIRRKDFLELATSGKEKEVIPLKVATRLIDKLLGYEEEFLLEVSNSYLHEDTKTALKLLLEERFARLR